MKKNTHTLGALGEQRATEYLIEKGYSIIKRNFRFERGEIDIIARINNTLVFVEVKTAQSQRMGRPESWVTPAKQQQIGKVAEKFLYDYNDDTIECRFDVIGLIHKNGEFAINHIPNAFWLTD